MGTSCAARVHRLSKAFGLATLLCAVLTRPLAPVHAAGVADDLQTLSQELQRQYQVSVTITPPPSGGGTTYTPVDDQDAPAVHRYLALLREELPRHDPQFIRSSGLKTICFVKAVQMEGNPTGGAAVHGGTIALVAAPALDHEQYARGAIHHELYHLLDYSIFGITGVPDPIWLACNPPNWEYGQGSHAALAFVQKNPLDLSKLDHGMPGFIDLYSRTCIAEDKAEIFAALFVPERVSVLEQWAHEDPSLAAKLRYMRRQVAYYSQEHSTPKDRWLRDFISIRIHGMDMGLGPHESKFPFASRPGGGNDCADFAGFNGWRPLHWAAATHCPNAILLLLKAGADANAPDEDGYTPLHVAAICGDADTARQLMRLGADKTRQDKMGRTASDWAGLRGHKSLAIALRPPATRPRATAHP